MSRRHHVLGCCISALMLCATQAVGEENIRSANDAMRGCRVVAQDADHPGSSGESFEAGYCLGVVKVLRDFGPGVCAPFLATDGQAVKVVVQYIDTRPAGLQQNFTLLARDALIAAWPCKK